MALTKILIIFLGLILFSEVTLGESKLSIFYKDLNDKNRIVLVGIKNPNFTPFPLKDFLQNGVSAENAGFEPKFLVSLNEKGPQVIYSFELGQKSSSGLPKSLINVAKVKR